MKTNWTEIVESPYEYEIKKLMLWMDGMGDGNILLVELSLEYPHEWKKETGGKMEMIINKSAVIAIVRVPALSKETVFPASQFSLITPQINMDLLEIQCKFKSFIEESIQSIPSVHLQLRKKEVNNG